MEVVVNKCYGGFGLSLKAIKRYLELKGKECYFYKQTKYSYDNCEDEFQLINDSDKQISNIWVSTKNLGDITNDIDETFFSIYDIERTDPDLIKVIEELGMDVNDSYSKLVIVEIPNDVSWYIREGDGYETVEEQHRSW